MSENWFHKKAETNQFPLKSTIRIQKWEEATPNNHLSPFFMEDKIQKEQAGTKCVHDRNHARLVHAISLTVHDKSWTLFQFKKNRNLFWLMYVSFGYELTFHKKKEKEESCFNCFAVFGARQQCVLRWESLSSCKATTRSSAGDKSSAIESLCVYAITTVKRTWERGWSSPLCIIFFWFRHCAYFTDGRKTALPQPKQKHMQGALSKRSMYLGDRNPILDRLTWYYSKK